MNAYDDYAAEIKDKLDSLDIAPVVPLVPERGNGGIGGRDRSKGKVRVMGAKLDADVAGTQALDAKFATEEHERLFQAGVKGMRKGEYRAATTAFTQAIAAYPGGMTSRKGGEYAVWLAQALHARGQTDEAKELLKSFEKHPDGDVRSVADSVLYIYQAPELKLGEENFMRINMDLATNDDWGRRRGPPKQLKDPPPEKYSIEWYLERAKETERSKAAPDTKRAGGSVAALALLTAASAAAFVLF